MILDQRSASCISDVRCVARQADEADANREEIRKILGTETIRQLVPTGKASSE